MGTGIQLSLAPWFGQALRADAGRCDELIAAVRGAGPIDIFVYNAGLLVFGDPLPLDADEVDRMMDVNVRVPISAAWKRSV